MAVVDSRLTVAYADEEGGVARHALPRLDLLQSALLGVLAGAVAIAAPVGVRWAFGTIAPSYAIFSILSLSVTLGLGFVPTTLVAQRILARGGSLALAAFFGLVSAVPVMVTSYLACLACQRAFPAVTILDPSEPRTVTFSVLTALADALPWLVAWAGLVFTPALLRAHEHRQRAVEAIAREAELLRLRSHLEPHFVLNTMNAIAGLVTEEPTAARELLGMLGDIFRDATDSAESHTVDAELAWLTRYVRIHELRFPDQLETCWDIEEGARSCLIPNLLLQPLVENALMHGALRAKHGVVDVRAKVDGDDLIFEVRDNGPALGPRRPNGKGVRLVERRLALESTPGRLELLREGDITVARVVMAMNRRPRSLAPRGLV